jgi:hypothetical protein
MAQSLIVEWLNENEFRSYPLRFARSREVKVAGLGTVSLGGFNASVGGYLLNGGKDAQGVSTQFLTQVGVGDLIGIQGSYSEVILPPRPSDMTDSTLYVKQAFPFSSSSYSYSITKRNFSGDALAEANFNFEGVLLDANLVYHTLPEEPQLVGKLLAIYPEGSSLRVSVGGQALFTIPDYTTATYPYYVRNADGSLLVLGNSAKWVKSRWDFVEQYFEPSTVTQLDGAWHGVTSLSFNSDTPLTGVIDCLDGYQLSLAVNEATNALKITAGRGQGKPIGCDRIFGEDAPADCGAILSFINSAFARTDFGAVNLLPGNRIAVYPDPDRHRIYVGLTFGTEDICKTLPARPVTQI